MNDKKLIKLIDKLVKESNKDRVAGVILSKQVLTSVDKLVAYVKENY